MKKYLLCSVLLLLALNLSAKEYNSNLLAQNLGEKDGSTSYTLKVVTQNNSVTTLLFYKENLIKEIIETKDNNKIIKETKTKDNTTKEIFFNGLLIEKEKDNTLIKYEYNENNLIILKKTLVNNILKDLSKYYYDNNDNLISIISYINGEYENKTFLENGKVIYKINKNSFNSIELIDDKFISNIYKDEKNLIDSQIKKENNILIIETKKDNYKFIEYYNEKGSLIKFEKFNKDNLIIEKREYKKESSENIQIEIFEKYGYSELNNSLNKIEKIENKIKDNQIISTKKYINNQIISFSYINKNGLKEEILYKNGKLYCTIKYSKNNKIIDITYKEESNDK